MARIRGPQPNGSFKYDVSTRKERSDSTAFRAWVYSAVVSDIFTLVVIYEIKHVTTYVIKVTQK